MATQNMQEFIARAQAMAEARKNRPTESFWPNIKRWLETREGDQPLPTCPVCYRELDIQGIDPVPSLGDEDETPSAAASASYSEDEECDFTCDAGALALILPCGHMTCHNCTLTSMEQVEDVEGMEEAAATSPCPVCRTPSRGGPGACGHQVHYHPATTRTDVPDWVERIPLTIPEGGSIPDLCWACTQYDLFYVVDPSLVDDEMLRAREAAARWDLVLVEDDTEENIEFRDYWHILNTQKPLAARGTSHHCCYYDQVFHDYHEGDAGHQRPEEEEEEQEGVAEEEEEEEEEEEWGMDGPAISALRRRVFEHLSSLDQGPVTNEEIDAYIRDRLPWIYLHYHTAEDLGDSSQPDEHEQHQQQTSGFDMSYDDPYDDDWEDGKISEDEGDDDQDNYDAGPWYDLEAGREVVIINNPFIARLRQNTPWHLFSGNHEFVDFHHPSLDDPPDTESQPDSDDTQQQQEDNHGP